MYKKILTSLLVIGLTIVLVGGATFAYFYDTETSAGNTFTASTLDLTVDGKDDPLPIKFGIETITSGESGTITPYVLKNNGTVDGYVNIIDVTVVNTGGLLTEPEHAVDPENTGSLGENMNIIVMIGEVEIYDGTLNDFEGDHNEEVFLGAGETTNVTIDWIVDSEVGNKIQGDIANVSITFELVETEE